MSGKRRLQFSLLFLVWLVFSMPSRAYAYGDPSGGMLFQILTPLLTGIWAMWMIFADNIRKRIGKVFGRTRGTEQDAAAAGESENAPLGD